MPFVTSHGADCFSVHSKEVKYLPADRPDGTTKAQQDFRTQGLSSRASCGSHLKSLFYARCVCFISTGSACGETVAAVRLPATRPRQVNTRSRRARAAQARSKQGVRGFLPAASERKEAVCKALTLTHAHTHSTLLYCQDIIYFLCVCVCARVCVFPLTASHSNKAVLWMSFYLNPSATF